MLAALDFHSRFDSITKKITAAKVFYRRVFAGCIMGL